MLKREKWVTKCVEKLAQDSPQLMLCCVRVKYDLPRLNIFLYYFMEVSMGSNANQQVLEQYDNINKDKHAEKIYSDNFCSFMLFHDNNNISQYRASNAELELNKRPLKA